MTLGYPRIFVCPLDSLSEFYKWHDAHARPSSTDRRRYAHQPLHRAAFMRTCSYTERFVHREAFTHRSLYTQKLSRKGVFTQKLLHTDALCKDAFAQRSLYAQTPLHRRFHTQKLLHGNLCKEQLLHKEIFLSPKSIC